MKRMPQRVTIFLAQFFLTLLVSDFSVPETVWAADKEKTEFPESPFLHKGISAQERGLLSENNGEATIDWDKQAVSRDIGQLPDRPDQNHSVVKQFKLGQMAYFFGDHNSAYQHWLPIAKKGFADAEANLGWLYQSGLGVERDLVQARDWYTKAARQEQPVAQNNLGILYEQGLGVVKDQKKAFDLYQRSARNGYRLGQYNLGLAYLEGKGTTKDRALARLWLSKAAIAGVPQAQEKLERIGSE